MSHPKAPILAAVAVVLAYVLSVVGLASRSAPEVVVPHQPSPAQIEVPSVSLPNPSPTATGTTAVTAIPEVATPTPSVTVSVRVTSKPRPTGSVGETLQAGWATHFPSSWRTGAMHDFRFGDEPFKVRVCLNHRHDRMGCVTVTVVSYCACGIRHGRSTVIDLSPDAFKRLAELSRGIVFVNVYR